jgi:hypothetical protein
VHVLVFIHLKPGSLQNINAGEADLASVPLRIFSVCRSVTVNDPDRNELLLRETMQEQGAVNERRMRTWAINGRIEENDFAVLVDVLKRSTVLQSRIKRLQQPWCGNLNIDSVVDRLIVTAGRNVIRPNSW